MISTIKYDCNNFPIPSEKVFEKLFNLDEPLTGQSVTVKSIFNEKDNTPSMTLFLSDDGYYRFKDFSSGRYGDIADVAQQLYGIASRQEAFVKIKKIFLEDGESIGTFTPGEIIKTTKEIISHKTRLWNKRDEIFWKQFYIGGKFLKEYNVKPICEYVLRITKGEHIEDLIFKPELTFGYFNNEGELCKIYNPLNKKAKFIKVRELTQGDEQLKFDAKCLIIASSIKDIGSFKAMKFKDIELIAPDSENVDVPKKKIELYKSKYEYVFTMFDNDVAGMKAMKHYQDTYGIPYIYFTVEKDIAECVKQHGPRNTKLFLTPVLKDAIRREIKKANRK